MNKEEIALNLVEHWGAQNGTAEFKKFVDNYLECLEKIGYIDDLKKENKELKDKVEFEMNCNIGLGKKIYDAIKMLKQYDYYGRKDSAEIIDMARKVLEDEEEGE